MTTEFRIIAISLRAILLFWRNFPLKLNCAGQLLADSRLVTPLFRDLEIAEILNSRTGLREIPDAVMPMLAA